MPVEDRTQGEDMLRDRDAGDERGGGGGGGGETKDKPQKQQEWERSFSEDPGLFSQKETIVKPSLIEAGTQQVTPEQQEPQHSAAPGSDSERRFVDGPQAVSTCHRSCLDEHMEEQVICRGFLRNTLQRHKFKLIQEETVWNENNQRSSVPATIMERGHMC
ncbi:unnamed protein product [Pleuronectes platessa]|uniref:Uncharacterized protein n=1 Tax=Pleuronectes platessa TaxID=8262 RepID=A0A9N7VXY7_PLEPL|nr:unnamed protein product [Pleuronectes platessa]